ncbi:hypothetical protein OESDEN_10290, partial [Oesophagostomum dentatum]
MKNPSTVFSFLNGSPLILLENLFLVPLRNQTNLLRTFLTRQRTEDERQHLKVVVDEEAVKIFKANYEKCELLERSQISSDEDISRSAWFSHFPCAKLYK